MPNTLEQKHMLNYHTWFYLSRTIGENGFARKNDGNTLKVHYMKPL